MKTTKSSILTDTPRQDKKKLKEYIFYKPPWNIWLTPPMVNNLKCLKEKKNLKIKSQTKTIV